MATALATRNPFRFGGLSNYREGTRRVFTGFGRRARSVGGGIQRAGSAAILARERARKEDTVGGIFADETGTMIAAGASGLLDKSSVGVKFTEFTGGRVQPATALAIFGAVAKGFGGLDRRFLGASLARANSALIRSMLIKQSYDIAGRIPSVMQFGVNADTVFGTDSVPKLSGAEPTSRIDPEPIPGESTQA